MECFFSCSCFGSNQINRLEGFLSYLSELDLWFCCYSVMKVFFFSYVHVNLDLSSSSSYSSISIMLGILFNMSTLEVPLFPFLKKPNLDYLSI
jgi:hypothetical protein